MIAVSENTPGFVPRWVFAIVAAVSAATMVLAFVFPMEATDTLCRYAPMAEAFAAGNWADAFHPRFAVGGSAVAGLFALLPGFDGLSACTVSATLAWALCLLPVFRLADRLFGRSAAWFALLLFALAPQPLLWGLKGLREPFKMLGLLLMADAVVDVSRNRTSLIEAAIGLVLLLTFKCDGILLGLVLAAIFFVVDRFRWRSAILAAVGLVAAQPMCWLVYDWTGYWLPAPHYVQFWKLLFG